jgi:uncharacterized membrane protein
MIATQPESGGSHRAAELAGRTALATAPVDATPAPASNGEGPGPAGPLARGDSAERCGWSLVWLAVLSAGVGLWGTWSSWPAGGVVAPLFVLVGIAGLGATWLVASPRSWTIQVTGLAAAALSTLGNQAVAIHVRQYYNTDAAAFNQVAARVLAHGADPYAVPMTSAARLLKPPSDYWTYTMAGSYVTHVSYPAGSFLLEAAAYRMGFHHEIVDWTDLFAWILTGVLIFVLLPSATRWLAGLLLLTPVFVGTFGSGGTDALFLPFLVLAVWRWDRFGLGREAGLARWIGPIALGLACSIKQTPWFCVPFIAVGLYIEARTSGRRPLRLAGGYLAVVAGVFLAVNLPFIIWQPSAWGRGVLLPFTSALVPDGQGLVTLALHGVARGASLPLLSLAGVLVLAALLAAFVFGYPVMKRAWMLLLPVCFFVATRSLSTYLLDLYPAALVAALTVRPAVPTATAPNGARTRTTWGLIALGSAGAAVVVSILAFLSPPLQIGVLSFRASQAATSLNAVTLTVHNNTDVAVTPHFMVATVNTNPDGFWYPADGRSFELPAHRTSTVTLFPSSFTAAPHHGSQWLVEAVTSSPEAVSTSPLQLWRLGKAQ